ncbi:MAG: hypothetical protein KGH67_01665 [Candidatus Micrarchaeota archaeon]|nr:hypothetical protein [Candidatus Micrarchaeota archaeon]MDE1859214.1 hypothetical protein [Candidatus Micrarchaeota archaeon]
MAVRSTSETPDKGNRTILVIIGILVVILILLFMFSQSHPPAQAQYNSTSAAPGQGSGPQQYYNVTQPSVLTTAPVQQNASLSPSGLIYCIGGLNNTPSSINASEFAQVYNTGRYGLNSTISWTYGPNYPLSVYYPSCVKNSDNFYCIGGEKFKPSANSNGPAPANFSNVTVSYPVYSTADQSSVYSAQLLINATPHWTQTTSYPQPIDSASCVAYTNYIYCTGGEYNFSAVENSYYATINGQQVGQWQSTTPYPVPVLFKSCVTFNGYIYCVGGAKGLNSTNAAYYAQLSPSGIGQWHRTASYPINVTSAQCVQSNGFIYCIGNNAFFGADNATYYAPLTSSGIGTWSQGTSYPYPYQPSECVPSNNSVYCIGASDSYGTYYDVVTYANISQSGIGQWNQLNAFPTPIYAQSCVAT